MKALNNDKGFNLVGIMTAAVVGSIMVTGLNTAIFKLARSQMKISIRSDLTWVINTAQQNLKKWSEEKEEDSTKEHTFTFPADDPRGVEKISDELTTPPTLPTPVTPATTPPTFISTGKYEACFEAVKKVAPIPEHLKDKYIWINLIDTTAVPPDTNPNKFIIADKKTPTIAAYNKEIADITLRCTEGYPSSEASVECYEVNDSNPSNLNYDPDKKRQSLVGCGIGTTDKAARPRESTFFGFEAGSKTTGLKNTFVGFQSGAGNISGRDNTFIGFNSGRQNISGVENTFLGVGAGVRNDASYNTFLGHKAGHLNTIGTNNTYVGYEAGRNTVGGELVLLGVVDDPSGIDNTFIGSGAGKENTKGLFNTFIGSGAGKENTKGHRNNFVGAGAGQNNITGRYNNFFGYKAGYSNAHVFSNNFFGYQAGYSNTLGTNNSFFGNNAGYSNTHGHGNNFFGDRAGRYNTTGSRNIFIGRHAGSHNTTGNENIYIGHFSGCTFSHCKDDDYKLNIGNTIVGNLSRTTPPHGSITINGELFVTSTINSPSIHTHSDKRLKTKIKPLSNSLTKLLKLKPSTYYWKDKTKPKEKQLGLIAQDIKKEFPELVDEGTDKKKLLSLNYIGLIPVIIKSFKEFYNSVTKSLGNLVTELSEVKIAFLENKKEVGRELSSLNEKDKKLERELSSLKEENRMLLKRIEKLEAKK